MILVRKCLWLCYICKPWEERESLLGHIRVCTDSNPDHVYVFYRHELKIRTLPLQTLV
jgi:hypothetical protein